MEHPDVRIYLSGSVTVEVDDQRLGSDEFPGQQGRVAFAYLVTRRGSPVDREALALAVWGEQRPKAWQSALTAIVSKLRGRLDQVGLPGRDVLVGIAGCYELRLPSGTWVDHECLADSIHEAEAALRAEDHARAYGPSAVAHHIARRPFLPGERGHWIEAIRERLNTILVRALECRAAVYLWNKEPSLAADAARQLIGLRPFLESGYRFLMTAHANAGNTAEALRIYEQCRALLREELGVGPSPETRTVHANILKATG